ncbi:disease resistance RPP13-like protein 4 [Camellia sinensis]|uniref:disease resistance RPP13-like protein 4 n=1 Tax=Camellia sinensis TaxID=4442 RepID=UPI0010357C61|nr:disease resistance RPP13-like protein 4 [Camellia sinensis]
MKKRNANVLDGLENVTHLWFLSLQGISRVREFPRFISKLRNLAILDIRACHNLEVIPNQIGLLKNLTHLDMSECYLLDQMPKGFASLYRLQVLSGFVVGDLEDIDMCALNKFKALTKLTIAWGRGSVQVKRYDDKNKHNTAAEQGTGAIKKVGLKSTLARTFAFKRACVSNAELPSELIKLDLQCFPKKDYTSLADVFHTEELKESLHQRR